MTVRRYPKLNIRSKNELAKHLSTKKISKESRLALINDVLTNFDTYWKDNLHESKPQERKYVRNAKHTHLDKLLRAINEQVLSPHDNLLPEFIFGGIKGKNHIKAAGHLLGEKRNRTLIKLDIQTFFEKIDDKRVYYFFKNKCGCSSKASRILANLCCIPEGPKDKPGTKKVLARGFATSSRLAIWCNLDTFLKLDWMIKKELKGYDSRIAIYVDDIGITASRVGKQKILNLEQKIEMILCSDKNAELPLNKEKTRVIPHQEGMEHLGIILRRNKLSLGKKTRSKLEETKKRISRAKDKDKVKKIKTQKRSLMSYKRSVETYKPAK
ncbi:MAG: hypothetical protein HGA67_02775 [Candidatus Yonathbacteria bacterium]|nr:hypothetical protein [Candidatus Yonathbacteria bacterium]